MNIRLRYFARLREAFGLDSESAQLPAEVDNVAALVTWLSVRGGNWAEELAPGRPYRVAVNQDLAGPDTPLHQGDEVALFPPVTGG